MIYDNIYKLACKFEKMAIRAVKYNPEIHQQLKEEQELYDPEDWMRTEWSGEPIAKEYGRTKKFDMREFQQLAKQDLMQAGLYAHRRLQKLGKGSSRAVYVYSPKYALKIAMNEAGIAQNQLEASVWRNGQYNEILAGVKIADPDGKWLLSELVVPFEVIDDMDEDQEYHNQIEEERQFEQYSPAPFRTMMEGISKDFEPYMEESDYEDADMGRRWKSYRSFLRNAPKEQTYELKRKTKLARDLVNKFKLKANDFWNPSNWGRTMDGRVVLLDYGFDNRIQQQFYQRNPRPEPWKLDWPELPGDESF